MITERIRACCLKKRGAYEDCPFGPAPLCFKIGGKIFAELYPSPDKPRVTLACDAAYAHALRMQYPNAVTAGYHCPERLKPYRNTIDLNTFPDETALFALIDHAYDHVFKKLPRRAREALINGGGPHEA